MRTRKARLPQPAPPMKSIGIPMNEDNLVSRMAAKFEEVAHFMGKTGNELENISRRLETMEQDSSASREKIYAKLDKVPEQIRTEIEPLKERLVRLETAETTKIATATLKEKGWAFWAKIGAGVVATLGFIATLYSSLKGN